MMPSRGKYIAMFILNFCFGVIFGLLSIGAFKTLNIAINSGDVAQAQRSAQKIKVLFIIGLAFTIISIVACIVIVAIAAANGEKIS